MIDGMAGRPTPPYTDFIPRALDRLARVLAPRLQSAGPYVVDSIETYTALVSREVFKEAYREDEAENPRDYVPSRDSAEILARLPPYSPPGLLQEKPKPELSQSETFDADALMELLNKSTTSTARTHVSSPPHTPPSLPLPPSGVTMEASPRLTSLAVDVVDLTSTPAPPVDSPSTQHWVDLCTPGGATESSPALRAVDVQNITVTTHPRRLSTSTTTSHAATSKASAKTPTRAAITSPSRPRTRPTSTAAPRAAAVVAPRNATSNAKTTSNSRAAKTRWKAAKKKRSASDRALARLDPRSMLNELQSRGLEEVLESYRPLTPTERADVLLSLPNTTRRALAVSSLDELNKRERSVARHAFGRRPMARLKRTQAYSEMSDALDGYTKQQIRDLILFILHEQRTRLNAALPCPPPRPLTEVMQPSRGNWPDFAVPPLGKKVSYTPATATSPSSLVICGIFTCTGGVFSTSCGMRKFAGEGSQYFPGPESLLCRHEVIKNTDSRSTKVPAAVRATKMENCKQTRGLLYADDLAVFAETRTAALKAFEHVVAWCKRNGMRLNYAKCGYMEILGQGLTSSKGGALSFTDDNACTHTIPLVTQYKYLGLTIPRNLSMTSMMEGRRRAVEKKLAQLQPLFIKRSATIGIKRMVYRGVILPVLLYGCEIWATGGISAYADYITVAHNKALRAMLCLPKNAPAEVFRHALGLPPLKLLIAQRVLRARERWSESRFPVRELMRYDVDTFPANSGTFFESQWLFVRKLFDDGMDALHLPAQRSFRLDVARRYAYVVVKEILQRYSISRRIWNHGYSVPVVADIVVCKQPKDFIFVNEWLRVICGFWKGCADYALYGSIDKKYMGLCPFCKAKVGEDVVHYIVQCPAWHEQRVQYLVSGIGSPFVLVSRTLPYTTAKQECLSYTVAPAAPVGQTTRTRAGVRPAVPAAPPPEDWDVLCELLRGESVFNTSCWYTFSRHTHKDKDSRNNPSNGAIATGETRVPVSKPNQRRLEYLLKFIHATSGVRRPVLESLRSEHAS